MKKLRVLVLLHEDLIPPEGASDREELKDCRTEYDVVSTLNGLGHEVRVLGVRYELLPIREAVDDWSPHIVFNLLEEFRDVAVYDQHMVAYLELMGVCYTGCSPRGLMLARDKALSKKILAYHRIPVPRFAVFPRGRKPRRPKHLGFPLIVKSLNEEASRGIAQASKVESDEKLVERVQYIHERIHTDAIVEQFIPGREIYIGVLGNRRLQVLPERELFFERKPEDMPLINTEKAKWDESYQEKWGIVHGPANPPLTPGQVERISRLSRRIYRRLDLSGYARLDFRLSPEGDPYFLEANPNPDIALDEEFSTAAEDAGIPYGKLLQKILGLGLRR
jgi:D-alanine-D-alanine ligase